MRKTAVVFVGLVGAASLVWMACGGADSTELSGGPDGGGDTGSTPPSNGDSGNPPPPPQPPPPPPPPADDGGSDAPDGTVVADGGVNPPDAGPGGSTTTLTCGTATCSIPAQSCCVQGGGGTTSFSCVAGNCPVPDAGAGGGDVTQLKCSGTANCTSGNVCCARQQVVNGRDVVTSQCQATCTGGSVQLCDPKAATSGCADAGATCVHPAGGGDLALPTSYGTCGGQGL